MGRTNTKIIVSIIIVLALTSGLFFYLNQRKDKTISDGLDGTINTLCTNLPENFDPNIKLKIVNLDIEGVVSYGDTAIPSLRYLLCSEETKADEKETIGKILVGIGTDNSISLFFEYLNYETDLYLMETISRQIQSFPSIERSIMIKHFINQLNSSQNYVVLSQIFGQLRILSTSEVNLFIEGYLNSKTDWQKHNFLTVLESVQVDCKKEPEAISSLKGYMFSSELKEDHILEIPSKIILNSKLGSRYCIQEIEDCDLLTEYCSGEKIYCEQARDRCRFCIENKESCLE